MEENKEDISLDSFVVSGSQPEDIKVTSDTSSIEDDLKELDSSSLDKFMTDDNSAENLDNIAINNNHNASEENTSSMSDNNVAPRPKLKKIKRLKIRSVSAMPVAPEKPSQENNDSIENNDFDSVSQGTDLITFDEAKDISKDDNFDNSYVLEDLPPELDYMTGDNGEAIYPETGIMAYKKPIIIAFCCFLFGMFLGASFFSSKTEESHGLEDVILNPDVPQGRPRCGLTSREQACIFYIMNCYKQELTGRDFFKLAATLTGREEYMIETENLRYATMKIKPGAFAQLNIPALK